MSKKQETMGNALEDGHTPSEEVPEGYKRTEVGVIPEDWCVSTIGAEFRTQLGKMLDAAKNTGVSKPYIGNRSVQWGRIDLDGIATVPMSMSDLQRFRLRRGDLLVCEGGEIGRAAIWNDLIPECYYQKAIHRLRPVKTYNVYLMMCLLQLWTSNGYLSNYVTQTSIAHLPKDKLEIVPLPIPPDAEQQAIAEALSDVDGLLAALEELIAKKRAVKQAAMQQLLTGKTRLSGFSGKWETKRLGDIGHCLRGVSYNPMTDLSSYDKDNTIRLLRSNNIQDAIVTVNDVHYVESRKVSESQVMQPNDILVCMANGSKELVGKAGLFHIRDGYVYTFGAFMGCFRIEPAIADSSFIFNLFQTCRFRDFIGLILAGSSINNLKPSDIESAEFQVPSRNEQRAIAAVLSDMDAEIAALEQRRDKAHAIKQGMMQQLLTGQIRLINETGNK